MKWLRVIVICALMVAVPVLAAASDPIKDCPEGLVCLTEAEAVTIEKKVVWMEREIVSLRNRLPKRFGAMYSVGVRYSPSLDQPFAGDACGGFYAGPLSICAGVLDSEAAVGVFFSKRF